MDIQKIILKQVKEARAAALRLALVPTKDKDAALKAMAKALWAGRASILQANRKDVAAAEKAGLPKAMIDRLALNEKRVRAMVDGVQDVVKLKDPVGEVLQVYKRPNGLRIEKVRTPIGVVGIIYESRPNVTADCAANPVMPRSLKGAKRRSIPTRRSIVSLRALWPGQKFLLRPFSSLS